MSSVEEIIAYVKKPLTPTTGAKKQPAGGFYSFGKAGISEFAGFMAAWSYFIGKLASGALMMHLSLSLLQQLVPLLQVVPILYLDCGAILLFVLLNMLNMKAGSTIQAFFTVLKLIPIFFAIAVCLFLFDGGNFITSNFIVSGIPATLPLLLYASMGFEAACLLSSKMENPKKNGPRAIFISYVIALSIAALYQMLFYGALGNVLQGLSGYLELFPTLLNLLFQESLVLAVKLKTILHIAIACSALGGSYGIMFSNTWNLHTLAQNNHIFFPKLFLSLNKYKIPVFCVLFEGLLYGLYLLITGGYQIPLQQLSALGVVFAYTISIISLLRISLQSKKDSFYKFVSLLALINCSCLIIACVQGLIKNGLIYFAIFATLLTLGSIMFFVMDRQKKLT